MKEIIKKLEDGISNNWSRIILYSAILALLIVFLSNAYNYSNAHNKFETVVISDVVNKNIIKVQGNVDISGREAVRVGDQNIFRVKNLSEANISVGESRDGNRFYTITVIGNDPADPIYYVYEKTYLPESDVNLFAADVFSYKRSVDGRSLKRTDNGWEFDVLYDKKSFTEMLDPLLLFSLSVISLISGLLIGFLIPIPILVFLALIKMIYGIPGFIKSFKK